MTSAPSIATTNRRRQCDSSTNDASASHHQHQQRWNNNNQQQRRPSLSLWHLTVHSLAAVFILLNTVGLISFARADTPPFTGDTGVPLTTGEWTLYLSLCLHHALFGLGLQRDSISLFVCRLLPSAFHLAPFQTKFATENGNRKIHASGYVPDTRLRVRQTSFQSIFELDEWTTAADCWLYVRMAAEMHSAAIDQSDEWHLSQWTMSKTRSSLAAESMVTGNYYNTCRVGTGCVCGARRTFTPLTSCDALARKLRGAFIQTRCTGYNWSRRWWVCSYACAHNCCCCCKEPMPFCQSTWPCLNRRTILFPDQWLRVRDVSMPI